MTSTILERVQHELIRQHITKAELMQLLRISDADYAGLATEDVSASVIVGLSDMLSCTCDYLCGLTESGCPTKRDDAIIGFTYKGRMEHLIQQLPAVGSVQHDI